MKIQKHGKILPLMGKEYGVKATLEGYGNDGVTRVRD